VAYPQSRAGSTDDRREGEVGVGLPACDGAALQRLPDDQYRVGMPVIEWNGRQLALWGVSAQGYNTPEDMEALAAALGVLLSRRT